MFHRRFRRTSFVVGQLGLARLETTAEVLVQLQLIRVGQDHRDIYSMSISSVRTQLNIYSPSLAGTQFTSWNFFA